MGGQKTQMKFSIECKVESKIELPSRITVKNEEKDYTFIPNEKNLLSSINIIVVVKNPEKFYSIDNSVGYMTTFI